MCIYLQCTYTCESEIHHISSQAWANVLLVHNGVHIVKMYAEMQQPLQLLSIDILKKKALKNFFHFQVINSILKQLLTLHYSTEGACSNETNCKTHKILSGSRLRKKLLSQIYYENA